MGPVAAVIGAVATVGGTVMQYKAQKKAAATLHDVRSAMKINYFDADGLENDYK